MIYRLTYKIGNGVPTIINLTLSEMFEEFPEFVDYFSVIFSAEYKHFTKLEFQNAKCSWCLEVIDEN